MKLFRRIFWRLRLSCYVLALGGAAASPAAPQELREFILASGPPEFDEQPQILDGVVIWRRYTTPGTIQGIELSAPAKIFSITKHQANLWPVTLTREYVFHLSDPLKENVLAVPLAGAQPAGKELLVAEYGYPVTSNSTYLFIAQFRGVRKLYAKALDSFEDPSLPREVTSLVSVPYTTRTIAASDDYFVWIDRASETDSWKVYAKPMSRIFDTDGERLVCDTQMIAEVSSTGMLGSKLDVIGKYLVVQSASDKMRGPWGIHLIDLETLKSVVVAEAPDVDEEILDYPSISEFYIVWTTWSLEGLRSFARPFYRGRFLGEAFEIGMRFGAGTWITIDGNIVVWNRGTGAIVGAELPLKGILLQGDADQNGRLNMNDAIVILNHLFGRGPEPRLELADADESGVLEVTDAIRILNYLFLGGEPPGDMPP
jgi:hypothetical protein